MGDSASTLFSARWQTRVELIHDLSGIIFSSHASGGSRVVFDEVIVLDAWEEFGSTFLSDPVAAGAGQHTIAFEYRSAQSAEISAAEVSNSYAQLSWHGFNVTTHVARADPLFADVGWFAVSSGTGSIHGKIFEAGYVSTGDANLVVEVAFVDGNGIAAPHMFAGYQAISSAKGGHCRLVEASPTGAAIALEFDSCNVAATGGASTVGWMSLSSAGNNNGTRVHQQPTFPSDVAALLAMASDLRLPGYMRWHNGSDPCRDRWAGIECLAGDQAPRVVVVDIHNFDLAGHELPWYAVGRLTALQELSFWVRKHISARDSYKLYISARLVNESPFDLYARFYFVL